MKNITEVEDEISEKGKEILNYAERFFRFLNNENILIGIIVVLVGLLTILSFFPNIFSSFLSKEKIYSLEVIKIEGCEECFDLGLISSSLDKLGNVKIKEEKQIDYNSKEAKKLIEKYKITKIPALILISRDIDKITLDENVFRTEGKTAIFDRAVPYFDLRIKEVKGIIELKEIYDSACLDCASVSNFRKQLENTGIKIKSYEVIDSKSEKGKELIKDNGITFLPSLLTSKNIEDYWWIFDNLKSILEENENYYRFSEPLFPYKEISTGKVKGKVKITYIINKSCTECFNVTELKSAFQEIGVYIESEKYADVSSDEGRKILVKYDVTAIPTVILSEEISDYLKIKNILDGVGSFIGREFVFRKLDALNVKYQKTGGE